MTPERTPLKIALTTVQQHSGGQRIYYESLRRALRQADSLELELPWREYPAVDAKRLISAIRHLGTGDAYRADISRLTIQYQASIFRKILEQSAVAPDVTHTQHPISTVAVTASSEVPVVQTVHSMWLDEVRANGMRPQSAHYLALEEIQREAWRKTDHFIVLNADHADQLEARGVEAERISIVHNAVDATYLRDTARESPVHGRYAAIACRLAPEKGVEVGIRAFREVANETDMSLQIVGDGPLREALESLVSELGLEDSVTFHGEQSHEVTLGILADAWCTLCPSIPHGKIKESAGLTILESMALETPVIASRIGGVPEYVEHRETGILVEPGDTRTLANAMVELDDMSAAVRTALTDNARAVVERRLGMDAYLDTLFAIYRDVASVST